MEANNAVVAVADAAVRSIVERRRRRPRRFQLGNNLPPFKRLPLRLAVAFAPNDALERVGKQRAATSKRRRRLSARAGAIDPTCRATRGEQQTGTSAPRAIALD